MAEKTIVMVFEQSDDKRCEVTIADDPHKAARLIEELLEAGFEQDRIRIFTGGEMEMQVTHRPVVALVHGDEPATARRKPDDAINGPTEPEAETEQALPRAKAELQEVEASVTPGVRDGVRFSSLFRPA